MNATAERRAATVPPRYRPLYLRVVNGKATRSGAIRIMCAECVGWEDVAEAIRGCTSPACPLYHHRPYRTKRAESAAPKCPETSENA
jgi:hypothetical protein